MSKRFAVTAIVLAIGALPTVGDAQTAPAPRMGDGPVSFGADAGEATPDSLSLRGRAEIVQGQNRLRADVISGSGANSEINRLEATGNVYFVTPEQTIRGDRAVYTLATNEIVMTGDVIVTQGQNVMTGGRLTYNTETQSVTMAGASGSNGGRIRGVFYPDRSGN